ncbi:MAG: adenylate/guanylate cyclase domain-containing protein [Gaiellaceae bacterium]
MDEPLLTGKLEQLAAAAPADAALLETLRVFLHTAPDDAVVRINPVRFAQEHGFEQGAVVELFLHARKVGLLTMEWQYICPGCGEVVERLASLTSATAHFFCEVCSADREAELSDFIEVAFSVSPEVRRSRYHEPLSLEPEDYFFNYRFTQSATVDDGTPLREHLRRVGVAAAYVEPGATEIFSVTAEPRYLWLTNGPALIVGEGRTDETRTFAFEYTGTRSKGFRAEIDAGPVEIEFTNATAERYPLAITSLPDHYEVVMQPFLSGAEVLSNQTFLDLFAAETIVAGEGLAVRSLALLFTDLQGSTALYERIGDMKAFDLVRQHFGFLRECITRNSGALVKTIGDAVMASFVDPLDALRCALDMRAEIARFNAEAGADLIGLKVGLHSGACLAVTLNDRLDYFGQTVNIAARVQGLSAAGEIVVTDDVLSLPGAAELIDNLDIQSEAVRLKGVAGDLCVHRVRGAPVKAGVG